jgi:hypothetical protein
MLVLGSCKTFFHGTLMVLRSVPVSNEPVTFLPTIATALLEVGTYFEYLLLGAAQLFPTLLLCSRCYCILLLTDVIVHS